MFRRRTRAARNASFHVKLVACAGPGPRDRWRRATARRPNTAADVGSAFRPTVTSQPRAVRVAEDIRTAFTGERPFVSSPGLGFDPSAVSRETFILRVRFFPSREVGRFPSREAGGAPLCLGSCEAPFRHFYRLTREPWWEKLRRTPGAASLSALNSHRGWQPGPSCPSRPSAARECTLRKDHGRMTPSHYR